MINGLCARYHAKQILEAPRLKRQKLLDEIPAHLRPSVMKIVVNEFEMRKVRNGK